MVATPKSAPASRSSGSSSNRAGFLKTAAIGLLGVSTASLVAGKPVVEKVEAAVEPLVETCETAERGELI